MSIDQPSSSPARREFDVIVVGGGQSALAVAYYLRRTPLSFALLDAGDSSGGAWRHTWGSLRLFSPAQWSSLPGRLMPGGTSHYPTRDEALDYLAEYERRYEVPVVRPVRVSSVRRTDELFFLETNVGQFRARAIVSATGTWSTPNAPAFGGRADYSGSVIHSAHYGSPDEYRGRRVVVVGGGNSGAQIVADLFAHATVTWATRTTPTFLPDDVDGRYLFSEETARYRAMIQDGAPVPPQTLGDIVMVPSVRHARERGALTPTPMFTRLTEDGVEWPNGRRTREDAIILATGFRPALSHLSALAIAEPNGRFLVRGTRSVRDARVWLVGYGDWTGYASATLIGVGRSARTTVNEIERVLRPSTGS